MDLKKFRIQNYKSIVDTGLCHINQNLTIFAGMNESGKTSILEAIRDFAQGNSVNKDAKRVKGADGELLISLYFRLNEQDIEHIYDELEISEEEQTPSLKDFLLKNDIGITKNIKNEYLIETDTALYIHSLFSAAYKEHYKKHRPILNKLKAINELSNIDFSTVSNKSTYSDIYDLIEKIKKIINPTKIIVEQDATGKQIKKEVKGECNISQEVMDEINVLLSQIEADEITTFGYNHYEDYIDDLKLNLLKIMPKIIFFSSFDDHLEYNVPINEIDKNQINLDLCNIANIDTANLKDMIAEENYQGIDNYLSEKSANISNVFKTEWLQDEININFSSDKEIIHFSINENGDTAKYRADQRSKGFQWFLSFYIRLNTEKNRTNIILVDEPGLYLHAKAQDDVLRLLEKLSADDGTCVLFTTHSPYLIDIDKLSRVLLIEKDDKNGTKILKAHKGANKNTLTPIITKMGFDISKANFIREKNILVEGISDYYYIQAFKKLFNYNDFFKNISIVPAVGASQVPQLASFCIGWGLEYVALFDNDTEGKRFYNEIVKNLDDKASVSYICEQENCAIEDLFTKKDFNNFVLKYADTTNSTETQNSKFLKENSIEKPLIAKLFYDNINKIKKNSLDEQTIENFEILFEFVFEKLNIKKNTKS